MIIQFCGLSGSGKTTLANEVQRVFKEVKIQVEILDGDVYRTSVCKGLGFSKEDRNENIRRLGFVASRFSVHNIVAIICAINPYEETRREIAQAYPDVITVYIKCGFETLTKRDTKGLYKRAFLPNDHPEKINDLSGVNDTFEIPINPTIVIETDQENIEECTEKLCSVITSRFKRV